MLMIGYKLFRKRKDGTFGPLFINRKQRLEYDVVYDYEDHPTKGYAHRPGWHICQQPIAPHLSKKDRVWCVVEFEIMDTILRPESQGCIWFLGKTLKIIAEMKL